MPDVRQAITAEAATLGRPSTPDTVAELRAHAARHEAHAVPYRSRTDFEGANYYAAHAADAHENLDDLDMGRGSRLPDQ